MRWGAVAAGATATRGGSRPLRARVPGPSICISIGSPAETTSVAGAPPPAATRSCDRTQTTKGSGGLNRRCVWATAHDELEERFFYYYFLFSFFTKIYFRFGNLLEYSPAARQRGGRSFCEKNFAEKIAQRSLGASRPAAGRPALAARLRGDRP